MFTNTNQKAAADSRISTAVINSNHFCMLNHPQETVATILSVV